MDNNAELGTTQEVKVTETVVGKTKFGLGQINKPTPMAITWIFRFVLYICSIGTFIITTDDSIKAEDAKRYAKYLAITVVAVHSGSKLFGVQIDEGEFKN